MTVLDGPREARPARARLELVERAEERLAGRDVDVDPRLVVVPELVPERRFGRVVLRHFELQRRQLLLQLRHGRLGERLGRHGGGLLGDGNDVSVGPRGRGIKGHRRGRRRSPAAGGHRSGRCDRKKKPDAHELSLVVFMGWPIEIRAPRTAVSCRRSGQDPIHGPWAPRARRRGRREPVAGRRCEPVAGAALSTGRGRWRRGRARHREPALAP